MSIRLIIKGVFKGNSQISSIKKWTDAFIVYESVLSAAHPYSSQGLLKYMRHVRLGPSIALKGIFDGEGMMNNLDSGAVC